MVAGAEAAAVRATSQPVKRHLEEEDSQEAKTQINKQIKSDSGLSNMAHAFASLTLHDASEETKETSSNKKNRILNFSSKNSFLDSFLLHIRKRRGPG